VDEKARNKEIEKMLKETEQLLSQENKILLLGPGDSGKSTIVRQMKLIHLNGYTDKELKTHKPIVLQNVLLGIQSLIFGCHRLRIDITEGNSEFAQNLLKLLEIDSNFLPQNVTKLKALWLDQGIQEAYKRNYEFQLPSSWT
jgi:hypothetical protein